MAKRISLKERICFWLLKRRFTTETYVMLDRLGNYHVSTRKKGHKVYHMIDKEYANAVVTVGTGEKAYHPADGRSYYAGFKYSF